MYKNATYREKYAQLKDWMPSIIESIKKDLKNEHLRKDPGFWKTYLGNKNPNKITTEDLVVAYGRAMEEDPDGEGLGEFISSRWLLRHSDIYEFFERHLAQIDPDFTELKELTQDQSKTLVEASVRQFGALKTYLFSVLNSVVFPESVFKNMEIQARQERKTHVEEAERRFEQMSIENMSKEFEREIARLTDKYEKKLAGLQKKYVIDVDGLKKQVAQLQRKLQEKGA